MGGEKKEEGYREGVGGREEEYRGKELERLREARGFFLKFWTRESNFFL